MNTGDRTGNPRQDQAFFHTVIDGEVREGKGGLLGPYSRPVAG